MSSYIMLDLEWNQSLEKEDSIQECPFEILEIGAVKLDEAFRPAAQFRGFVRPRLYRKLHFAIRKLTHLKMEVLKREGEYFPTAAASFLAWCGEDPVFCTWGNMDLWELQRNMAYYRMASPFPRPLLYYDVQALYKRFYDRAEGLALDAAVRALNIEEDRPFHQAVCDAWYTGKVFSALAAAVGRDGLLAYPSVDYFQLPRSRREEFYLRYPDSTQYISCPFADREEALRDREVVTMRCLACGRLLRKKVRWFSQSQKVWYALAFCPEHGYVAGRLQIKRTQSETVFAVKTLTAADEEKAGEIRSRKLAARKKRLKQLAAQRKK